jgi:predicted porin
MQKKLIALAVAGLASSAAFAQTNVTVYGVADGSFDYVWQSGSNLDTEVINTGGRSPTGVAVPGSVINPATSYSSRQNNDVSFSRISQNSSYLGFKGTEDLGNGLKAIFQYETTVNFDSGGGFGGSRDSFVGLSHANAGTIVLGNLTGPTRALGAALDVNPGATGIGANSGIIGKIAGSTLKSSVVTGATITQNTDTGSATIGNFSTTATLGTGTGNLGYSCGKSSTCTSIFDTRWQNAIAYLSPNWGGFSFAAAYTNYLENTTPDYGTVTPLSPQSALATVNQNFAQGDTFGYDIGAKWEGGGFMAGVTYNWAQLGDWASTEVKNLRVGGMYAAPVWSVRAMWEQTEFDINQNLIFNNTKQQKFGLGGTFAFGKTTLLAQWYGTNDADNISDSKANLFEVGLLYNLSKRTMLKATWAMIDNDDGSAADFGVNAIGNQSAAVNTSATVNNTTGAQTASNLTAVTSGFGATNQGIQVGIRHSF